MRWVAFILLLLIFDGTVLSQKRSHFFEGSLMMGQMFQSKYLYTVPAYQKLVITPQASEDGFLPSENGKIYGLYLNFGYGLAESLELVTQFGFSNRNEDAYCICRSCDKIYEKITLTSVRALELGIGIRKKIYTSSSLDFGLQSLAKYFMSSGGQDSEYFGFSFSPIFGYKLLEPSTLVFQFGYQQAFDPYKHKEYYIEIGYNTKY